MLYGSNAIMTTYDLQRPTNIGLERPTGLSMSNGALEKDWSRPERSSQNDHRRCAYIMLSYIVSLMLESVSARLHLTLEKAETLERAEICGKQI